MRIIVLFILFSLAGAGGYSLLARANTPQTLIKTDRDTIIFIVNGQEQARIDTEGLHVNGNLNYSGVTIDTGTYTSRGGQ